jgi:hypothetical protein
VCGVCGWGGWGGGGGAIIGWEVLPLLLHAVEDGKWIGGWCNRKVEGKKKRGGGFPSVRMEGAREGERKREKERQHSAEQSQSKTKAEKGRAE